MNAKNITLIVVLIIWFISFILSGILVLVYKNKYKSYKVISEQIANQFIIQSNNFLLTEKTLSFSLPKDEVCYFASQDQVPIKIKIKNQKINKIINEFEIYVSNLSVVFKINDNHFKYRLTDLLDLDYVLVYYKKQWTICTKLRFNKNIFLIKTNDFNLYLTLKHLKKKEVE